MRLLLDTHAFLWWALADERLSETARAALEEGRNEVLFSAVSAWEIAIKWKLGKLALPRDPASYVPEMLSRVDTQPLAVSVAHALHVSSLPPHHADPFDRLLIAQAQVEAAVLLTNDGNIACYGVRTLW